MRRSLSLKRESLAPLSTGELTAVAGGSHFCIEVSGDCTHASLEDACPTLPVYPCLSINPGCSVFCTV